MGRLTDKNLVDILAHHEAKDLEVCIETGTWLGTQLEISARHFTWVEGIELDRHFHQVSSKKTAHLPNVRVHRGDTREILPVLLEKYAALPVFIVLDAHYFATADPPLKKSEFPLWEELELLKNRNQPDIISVDDVHTFGVNREELRYKEGAEEWETVTIDSILEFMGDRVVDSEIIGDSFILWMKS